MKLHGVVGALAVGSLLAGCGAGTAAKGHRLVESDRSDLRAVVSVNSLSGAEGRAFQRVFGGTSGTQIDRFVDTHVKHVIDSDEHLRDFFNVNVKGLEASTDEERKRVAAANMGAALWLESNMSSSDLFGRSIEFKGRNGERVNVTSPKVGIVQLGDLYAREVKASDDPTKKVQLPWQFRVGILIHEGKHSDCADPSEVTQAAGRASLRSGQLSELACAHPHGKCPSGHDMAGLAACDTAEDRMGPYLIEALFLASVEDMDGLTTREKNFIRAQRIDSQSRVTRGYHNVIGRALGETRAPATTPARPR